MPLRTPGVWLLAVLLLAGVGPASASAAPAPNPGVVSLTDIRITKSGVTALLTAQEVRGATIDPASVKAMVGGVRARHSVQPIARLRRVTTLLIDTSGSMGAAGMATVVRATDAFLASVPPDVYVGAIAFADAPRVIVKPTRNRATVRAAIAKLKSQGGTSLYDGLAFALAQLGTTGERSFVLLSDGADNRSRRTLAQTRAALSESGVRAQVVGFRTSQTQGSVLSRLASSGQGRVVAAGNSAAVSAAFTVAAQALESQIRIFVTTPPGKRGMQPLVVSASAGGRALESRASVNFAPKRLPRPSASPVAPTTAPVAPTTAPVAPTTAPVAPTTARVAPTTAPTTAPVAPTVAPVAPTTAPVAPTTSAPAVNAAPPVSQTGGFAKAWMLWLALIAVFLGLSAGVGIVAMPAYVSARQRRVDAMEGYLNGTGTSPADEKSAVSSIAASLVNLGDKVMDSRGSSPKTQRLLDRADLPLRMGEWAVMRVMAIVVGVAGGMILMRGGSLSTILGACLGVLVGAMGPALFLKFAASRRSKKFESQLPDVLTLVASSLSTGFSLLQSLDAVARDAAQPSAKEFSRALAETRIGADLNDSLDHLADRMESTNLRWTNMAINIQRQVGGNLGETLRSTAATLRDRESLSRHVSALSAEGKLSAYILIGLPVGVFCFMLVGNREYVELLWTRLIGIGMLVGALISMGIGILWMNKVVKVEI